MEFRKIINQILNNSITISAIDSARNLDSYNPIRTNNSCKQFVLLNSVSSYRNGNTACLTKWDAGLLLKTFGKDEMSGGLFPICFI